MERFPLSYDDSKVTYCKRRDDLLLADQIQGASVLLGLERFAQNLEHALTKSVEILGLLVHVNAHRDRDGFHGCSQRKLFQACSAGFLGQFLHGLGNLGRQLRRGTASSTCRRLGFLNLSQQCIEIDRGRSHDGATVSFFRTRTGNIDVKLIRHDKSSIWVSGTLSSPTSHSTIVTGTPKSNTGHPCTLMDSTPLQSIKPYHLLPFSFIIHPLHF